MPSTRASHFSLFGTLRKQARLRCIPVLDESHGQSQSCMTSSRLSLALARDRSTCCLAQLVESLLVGMSQIVCLQVGESREKESTESAGKLSPFRVTLTVLAKRARASVTWRAVWELQATKQLGQTYCWVGRKVSSRTSGLLWDSARDSGCPGDKMPSIWSL